MVFGGGSTASNAVTDIAFYTAANNTTVEGTERMRITSAGLIGIGITAPLGKAHIYAGASLGTPNSGSNLIIEDNGTNIIQLLSPNTTVQGIMFGDSESPFAGYIRYSHADDEMSFYTDHTKRLLINSSGYVGIGASVTPLSLLDVSGGDIYIDHNQGISLVDNRSGTAVIRNMIKGTYPDGAVSNLGTIEIGQNTNRVASIFFSTQNGDRGMNFAQGKLGIGVGATNPTAYLEIKAGTAAAGTAPIKLTAGLLLTTPETGTIEFYGNKFTITNKSARKVIDRTSDVKLTTSTVTNDIAETTVFTGLLPANSLVAGNILKLEMFGTIDEAAASDEVTIRIKVGTMTMATIVSPASGVSAKCWHIKGSAIVRTVGASGEMAWHIDMDAAGNSEDGCGVDTVDTTAAENITVTAEWSAAKAGNIFTCTGGFIEYKN